MHIHIHHLCHLQLMLLYETRFLNYLCKHVQDQVFHFAFHTPSPRVDTNCTRRPLKSYKGNLKFFFTPRTYRKPDFEHTEVVFGTL